MKVAYKEISSKFLGIYAINFSNVTVMSDHISFQFLSISVITS